MKRPSLRELRARERRESAEGYRARLLAEASALGLNPPPDLDIFDLMHAVHRAQDERDWPKVAAEAEALGIASHRGAWPLRRRRGITELRNAIYDEREHRSLFRRYGAA